MAQFDVNYVCHTKLDENEENEWNERKKGGKIKKYKV